jgi:hypothetical protein
MSCSEDLSPFPFSVIPMLGRAQVGRKKEKITFFSLQEFDSTFVKTFQNPHRPAFRFLRNFFNRDVALPKAVGPHT